MKFLDWLLPGRRQQTGQGSKSGFFGLFRRKRKEPEIPEEPEIQEEQLTDEEKAAREYEESGKAIINNFYSLLEDRTKEATEIKGHESPGAGQFSGIAQKCHDLIETWRNSVGDGVTGEALEQVEAEMKEDLELITNYYNTDYLPALDLQAKTFASFDNLLQNIITNLKNKIDGITEQQPASWLTRLFNFFTGR